MTEDVVADSLRDYADAQCRSMLEHYLQELPSRDARDQIAHIEHVIQNFDFAGLARDMVQNADLGVGARPVRRRSGIDEGPPL